MKLRPLIGFLEKLRASGKQTPFIVLTGYGDKEKAVRALRHGANDFLDKPWEEAVLETSIRQAIELGIEINYWNTDKTVVEEVAEFANDYSESNQRRLMRVMGEYSKESVELRKKIIALSKEEED